jgi:hypothetical protein
MPKSIGQLDITIFDWPDRFFVESDEPDRDYLKFWPEADPFEDPPPHFVDLEIYETGWCSCTDFRVRVEPYLFMGLVHRRECIHIIAARRFQRLHGSKPTKMPSTLF